MTELERKKGIFSTAYEHSVRRKYTIKLLESEIEAASKYSEREIAGIGRILERLRGETAKCKAEYAEREKLMSVVRNQLKDVIYRYNDESIRLHTLEGRRGVRKRIDEFKRDVKTENEYVEKTTKEKELIGVQTRQLSLLDMKIIEREVIKKYIEAGKLSSMRPSAWLRSHPGAEILCAEIDGIFEAFKKTASDRSVSNIHKIDGWIEKTNTSQEETANRLAAVEEILRSIRSEKRSKELADELIAEVDSEKRKEEDQKKRKQAAKDARVKEQDALAAALRKDAEEKAERQREIDEAERLKDEEEKAAIKEKAEREYAQFLQKRHEADLLEAKRLADIERTANEDRAKNERIANEKRKKDRHTNCYWEEVRSDLMLIAMHRSAILEQLKKEQIHVYTNWVKQLHECKIPIVVKAIAKARETQTNEPLEELNYTSFISLLIRIRNIDQHSMLSREEVEGCDFLRAVAQEVFPEFTKHVEYAVGFVPE